eukprot:m.27821 g.27821  ORF g.27821 m.27821 type:complete len:323 (-) comp10152_c0_seq1:432-1400(-)
MSSVLKEGFLIKQGDKIKSWKKRYFVLRHDSSQMRFEYFKAPGGDLLGTFCIREASQCRMLEPPNSPLQTPVLEITTPSRSFLLSAQSEADLREWAWAIDKTLTFMNKLQAAQQQQARLSQPDPLLRPIVPLQKSGYLLKKGGKRRNWKKRFFVLAGSDLKYYPSKEDRKKELGHIDLSKSMGVNKILDYRSAVVAAEQKNVFTIGTPGRTYFLAALSEVDLEDWLRVMVRAGCEVSNATVHSNSTFYEDAPLGDSASDSADDSDVVNMPMAAALPQLSSTNPFAADVAAAATRRSNADALKLDFTTPFGHLHEVFRPVSVA